MLIITFIAVSWGSPAKSVTFWRNAQTDWTLCLCRLKGEFYLVKQDYIETRDAICYLIVTDSLTPNSHKVALLAPRRSLSLLLASPVGNRAF
jgi:hypothetical protein